MPKLSEEVLKQRKEVMQKMKELNNRGMFPKGFGKTVLNMANERLLKEGKKETSLSRVNAVASGIGYNPVIVDCLLEITQENKLNKQLEIAEKLLNS